MTTKLISTLAVLAALAVAPASAVAATPDRAVVATSKPSIIAILIGFTPPIGTNHGS